MLRNAVITLLLVTNLVGAQEAAEDARAAQEAAEDARVAAAPGQQQPTPAAPATEETGGVKTLAGMSILGNEEAPKSLVIVPWKSSQIGAGLGVHDSMDDRPRPVDKEVFMREVHYFELRSGAQD